MLPTREADLGYAFDLSRDAGTYIDQRGDTLTLLRNGEKLLVTADVRELVRLLRSMLKAGEQ